MKRRAAMTISSLNAETGLKRLRMKGVRLFTEERPETEMVIGEIRTDANTADQEGAVDITDKNKIEYVTPSSHPRKVSSDESSAATTCLSSSLIMQLASISIKEEKKCSRTPTIPTKRGSLPFAFSKPLQTRIKTANKRASAPPVCLTPKKKVHSRRRNRNRFVILNNKIMTKTQGRRESIDSCLYFEPISLSSIVTP
ncbi:hypothetical protein ACHAWT_000032 [Skeletonema menzelii]